MIYCPMVRNILIFLLLAPAGLPFARADAVLFDALIARVGQEAITLNDVTRFRNVEAVMLCSRLRSKKRDREDLQSTLNRYVEEELFYLAARTQKLGASGALSEAIKIIRDHKDCREDWNQLGRLYGKAWETDSRPREGEGLLVRELEKRLMVDRFLKAENIGDRGDWIREARIHHPVKLYLD